MCQIHKQMPLFNRQKAKTTRTAEFTCSRKCKLLVLEKKRATRRPPSYINKTAKHKHVAQTQSLRRTCWPFSGGFLAQTLNWCQIEELKYGCAQFSNFPPESSWNRVKTPTGSINEQVPTNEHEQSSPCREFPTPMQRC